MKSISIKGIIGGTKPVFGLLALRENWPNTEFFRVCIFLVTQFFWSRIDSSFQEVNGLFLLLFKDNTVRTGNTRYFLPKVETKDYVLVMDGQNVFNNQPVKKWHKNI